MNKPFFYLFGNKEEIDVNLNFECLNGKDVYSLNKSFQLHGGLELDVEVSLISGIGYFTIEVFENKELSLMSRGYKKTNSTEDPLLLFRASNGKTYQCGILFED